MKLASFDIFDTALIRKCGKPENVFFLLAQKLFPDDLALQEDFIVWRRHIERKINKFDVTLSELYEKADFPQYTASELVEYELLTESENLVANPEIVELIQQRRREDYTITFISDMYLPSDFLIKILTREGCLQLGEKVFVSCEHHARKDIGTLYELVRKNYNPKQWIHCGDNLYSDIKTARRHHIKTIVAQSKFTAVEQNLIAYSSIQQNSYALSLLAGISREIRMEEKNEPSSVLAADFIAPAYIPYVKYILAYAKEKKCDRIYFLSRDGYILKQAAQEIACGVECRELFVSRHALILPYLALDFCKEKYLQIIDQQTLIRKNVSALLNRLGLSKKELEECQIGFDYEKISTQEQETDYLNKIFNSPFTEKLKLRANKEKELLLKYFTQEGIFKSSPALMVDVGWLGTSRLMINELLQSENASGIETLYYGIRGDVLPCCYGRYKSYFTVGKLSTENTSLIENYFSQSPNPSTNGYKENNGIIIPIWKKGQEFKNTPIIQTNVNVIKAMIKKVELYNFSPETLYSWAKISMDAITNLAGEPDLTPLLQSHDFDDAKLLRKLSIREILIIACGKTITTFDAGCLQYTVGTKMRKTIMAVSKPLKRILYPLYRKFF